MLTEVLTLSLEDLQSAAVDLMTVVGLGGEVKLSSSDRWRE
jgi:hypothetical protein